MKMGLTCVLICWCVVLVLALAAEFATQQLVSIWFAAGAVGALIVAAFGGSITVQILVFLLLSVLLLLLTRPVLRKLHDFPMQATNTDRNIGKLAVMVQAMDAETHRGRVRLEDVEWIAESESGTAIPAGATVRVTAVNGARLMVEPVTQQEMAAMH